MLLGVVNIAFAIHVHPGVNIPPACKSLPDGSVKSAFDGNGIHKQFILTRGRERNRLAGAVKAQNADAVITEFPPIDPAILSL